MRSPFRGQRVDKDRKVIRFGEKGRALVKYVGELPFEYRGSYTGTNYVWYPRKPKHWVDKRDLPGLAKAAGRDNLEGLPEEKPKKSRKSAPPPAQEAAQGGQGEEVKHASI